MEDTSTTAGKINYKAIIWDILCVISIIAMIIFAKLWYDARNTAQQITQESQSQIKNLEKINQLSSQQLNKKLDQTKKKVGSQLNDTTSKLTDTQKSLEEKDADLIKKDAQITALQQQIDTLGKDKQASDRWLKPLLQALDVSQDVYAMKWQANSRVLNDMENHSARAFTICQEWQKLIETLSPHPEFAPQVNKLKIRLAQAYSSLGSIGNIDLKNIDWLAAGMEQQRASIETRIWFSIGSQFARNGKNTQAKNYLTLAKASAENIPDDPNKPENRDYHLAMINLLEADINASSDPKKALKNYVLACEKLSAIVTAFPKNKKLHTAFVQACIDGATLSNADDGAGNSELLNQQAFKKILALLKKHPKLDKPKLLYANIKVHEAEELVRQGEQYAATKVLTEARSLVKKAGGDTLLSAEIESTQAFIHWDHGERTKALAIIDKAIASVDKLKTKEPENKEAYYRLASLYWVKSSMRINPSDAISDGQKSVKHLVELVRKGAGKREAASRRMIAIIYSDIGHQAYTSNQKKVAKQYFEQAMNQWKYLSKHWGESDEYKEGARWCALRIKSL